LRIDGSAGDHASPLDVGEGVVDARKLSGRYFSRRNQLFVGKNLSDHLRLSGNRSRIRPVRSAEDKACCNSEHHLPNGQRRMPALVMLQQISSSGSP
jgi:hypothetical protein